MPQTMPSKESGSRIQVSEAREKLAPVRGDVLKRNLVKFSQEGAKRCTEQVAQLADADQRTCVGIGVEALDKFEITLGVSDNFPDNDFARRHGQPYAAGAAPKVFKIAKLPKLPSGLEQMGLRDAVGTRYILDANEFIRMQRTEHQCPEGIIGIGRELNGNLPASGARMRRLDHRIRLPLSAAYLSII